MIRCPVSITGTAIVAFGLSAHALAQGVPQTVSLMKVDPQSVATGYRSSKIVGATVVNENNETVGTIDDLIVTPTERVPYAVLSVGGFHQVRGAVLQLPSDEGQTDRPSGSDEGRAQGPARI